MCKTVMAMIRTLRDALGGAPGIYSADIRDAHGMIKQNNIKLLGEMREVAAGERTATFGLRGCSI
jgi:inosine/xanthosine triphosphate pyrophosphatase family protein